MNETKYVELSTSVASLTIHVGSQGPNVAIPFHQPQTSTRTIGSRQTMEIKTPLAQDSAPQEEKIVQDPPPPTTKLPGPSFTIDQITCAYQTLSSPALRARYDAALSRTRPPLSTRGFQPGIETLDLDDLAYDTGSESWSRACRCGNERGYLLTEGDLEEAGGEGEVLVGCRDCSLWLRVCFAVVEG
jgi:CSL zinc finger protein